MYCKNCGQEVNDNAVVCIHCGCAVETKNNSTIITDGTSKKGMGVLFGLLLGLIGLIIGIVMYPADSYERKPFIKGWCITFAISIGLSIILFAVGTCSTILYELY